MNYYISDLHLGQENICFLEKRPFSDVHEMDETIISSWNNRVKPEDTVYILGDMIWLGEEHWAYYLQRLSGQKVLIRGNHDPKHFRPETAAYFEEIADFKEISDGEDTVILCHYPIPFHRDDYDEHVWMLYGHLHNAREYKFLKDLRAELKATQINPYRARGNFINVGCMLPWMDYTPRTLEELKKT